MDEAMNSTPFFEAASRALAVSGAERDTVSVLNGATWSFQVVGIAGIGWLGHLTTYCFFTSMPAFEDIPNVNTMCLWGGAICALVALPFTMLIDTVSDTIL